MFISILIIIGFILIKSSDEWPNGAPEKACAFLRPSHGVNVAKSSINSPFLLTQSSIDYYFGGKIKVVLSSPSEMTFKGIMVYAYDPTTHQPIGFFIPGRGLKTIDSCSSVTHTDNKKKRSATLIWQAPADRSGKVSFIATVVERFSEFYVGIHSTLA